MSDSKGGSLRSSRPDESIDPSLFSGEQSSLSDPLPIDQEGPDVASGPLTAPRDILFGKIAVQERFINEAQLEEAVAVQKMKEPKVSIGRVMQDRGYLTSLQIEVILDIQRVNMADRQEKPQAGGLFGSLAVSAGFCTKSQIEDAIRRQKETQMPMGRILFEAGHLNSDQVLEVLRRQEKGSIRCDGCGSNYLIEGLAMGTKFACRRCFKVISITEAVVAPPPQAYGGSPAPGMNRPPAGTQPVQTPAPEFWMLLLIRSGGILWPALFCILLMAAWPTLGTTWRLVFGAAGGVFGIVTIILMVLDARNAGRVESETAEMLQSLAHIVEALEARWTKLVWMWNQYGAWEKIGRKDPKELIETGEAIQKLKKVLHIPDAPKDKRP